MSQVIIQEHTTKNPIQLIGEEAGVCWGADTTDEDKNYQRGLDCILSKHGRTWEFPQIYMILDGYSARVMREFYTHIGGAPTRLQASTRYIDYESESGFEYITPSSIANNSVTKTMYDNCMSAINNYMWLLKQEGVSNEDIALLLPLGMTTKVVVRTNFRNLVDMSRQRMCNRAYWEFRQLMFDIAESLINYSKEWRELAVLCLKSKCEEYGYCTEKNSCGRIPRRGENKDAKFA